jgi:hypothetical protein
MLAVRCIHASRRTSLGRFAFLTSGQSFRAVWMDPFAQRCCWLLKEFISTGTSAGVTRSER